MDEATCNNCGKTKPLKEFNWKIKSKKKRHSTCRECHKKYKKQHYQDNKQYYKDKAREFTKKKIIEHRQSLKEYLEKHPCVDCGETDLTVLTFDHVRGKKKYNISDMIQTSYAWSTIEKEIKKCEVRCHNCHMRRTAKRAGWGNLYLD